MVGGKENDSKEISFRIFALVKSCLKCSCLVAVWAEVSLSHEIRKISHDSKKKVFSELARCFAENPNMIF